MGRATGRRWVHWHGRCGRCATFDTFADVVTAGIDLGNDTDSVTAVAGALAGATYGIQSIPTRWVTYLHGQVVDDVLKSIDAFRSERRQVVVRCHGGRSRTGLVLAAHMN